MMNVIDLSKMVSHALRHKPEEYGLFLDEKGWVLLSDLLIALNKRGLEVTGDDIVRMIDETEKKRHQILNGKIRAYYGHSTESKINKVFEVPPAVLYHGTNEEHLKHILVEGLLPMKRQYVHLSTDEKTAQIVGSRKGGNIIILKVFAKKAHEGGVMFYQEENGVWLSEKINSQYIIVHDGIN